ncbi:reverse transcriptase domain-containing protein [Tanacetum coccineum]
MPKYAKFLKGLLSNKARLEEACIVTMNERCSAVLLNKLPSKEKDLGSFTIPCNIRHLHIDNALADLGAIEDVLMKIDKFFLPIDFVILDMQEDSRIPIILGRPFLGGDESCPVIISSKLMEKERASLLWVLEKCKGAIAWKMSDIKGISLSFCTHKILMEESFKPVIQSQRRLNLKVEDVVKDEIVRLLDSGLIYPISDSPWGGVWFFQIPITPEEQEKTTFTCPCGTFAYRRMPFGLCNAPKTFQRCMTAIFHDMIKCSVDVKNLVQNWEKCHFMVKEGIVLGHKISGKGIKVDKAKIDIHKRFFNDFQTNDPAFNKKNAKFDFYEDCKKAFNKLKERLTIAPIIISPDWSIPFELMCDASDFAIGEVLGQRIDGKFKPIYYASKTLNDAQAHYTTTEKELLAVVFSFDKFRPYLILSKTVVYTDHSALK